MVGYNFQSIFEPQVRDGSKRQTVRAPRARHARPGEPIQLFTGMRSRACRRLVHPNPICIRVREIEIAIDALFGITAIAIEGIPLDRDEIELFAKADGFDPSRVGDWLFKATGRTGSARENMSEFWTKKHGAGRFDGFLIQWEPA